MELEERGCAVPVVGSGTAYPVVGYDNRVVKSCYMDIRGLYLFPVQIHSLSSPVSTPSCPATGFILNGLRSNLVEVYKMIWHR